MSSQDAEMEECYEVEYVTNHKVIKGYTEINNTWEKETELSCKHLIAEYLEKLKVAEEEEAKKEMFAQADEPIPDPPFK